MLAEEQQYDPNALPPFANKANRLLAIKIQEKERSILLLTNQIEDNTSRATSMTSHIRSLKQEMNQNQSLFDAKSRQLNSEVQLKKLAVRESDKLSQETLALEKEIQAVNEQTSMYKGTEKIDILRAEMNLSTTELKDWLAVQQEREDDNLALQKYTHEDEAKIKSLSIQIEAKTIDLIKQTSLLDMAVTDTQVSRLELVATTEQFQKNHDERLDLVSKWATMLDRIQKKDTAILDARDRYRATQQEISEKKRVIDAKQIVLDKQIKENKEREKKNVVSEGTLAKTRLAQVEENVVMLETQDQLLLMKSDVHSSSSEINSKKLKIAQMEEQAEQKSKMFEDAVTKQRETQERLEAIISDKLTLEAKSKMYETIMKQEEMRNKQLDKDLKSSREQQFKKGQELFRLKNEDRNIKSEICSAEAGIKMLYSKLNKMGQEALKHQAIIYAQDFQIEVLDKKYRRAQGERSDDEKEVLELKIKELKIKLERENKTSFVLNNQLRNIQDDLRGMKRNEESLLTEKTRLDGTMQDTNLYLEGVTKQLSNKTREKENCMVEESILSLELRKLREYLNSHADQVYSLSARKLQLSLALDERNKEISIHRDILRVQMKNAEEERVSAALELKDRVKKVEHMKQRYELLMKQLNSYGEEGVDDGQEKTQAYYIIKAAQKKDELHREGDALDKQIKKAEKDVVELENTLKFMLGRNEMYKNHVNQLDLDSRDVQHKEMLEQQYEAILRKYKTTRTDFATMNDTLCRSEQLLNKESLRESNLLEAVTILEMRLSTGESEFFDQDAKRMRALKSISKITKEFRDLSKNGRVPLTVEEEDLKVRFCKDKTNTCIAQIIKLGNEVPELFNIVRELFFRYDIQPPTQPVSRSVSRPESTSGSIDGMSDSMSVSGSLSNRRRSSQQSSLSKLKLSTGSNQIRRSSFVTSQPIVEVDTELYSNSLGSSASSSRSAVYTPAQVMKRKSSIVRTKRAPTVLEARAAMKASLVAKPVIFDRKDSTFVSGVAESESAIVFVDTELVHEEAFEQKDSAAADRYVRLGRRTSVGSMSSKSDNSSRM